MSLVLAVRNSSAFMALHIWMNLTSLSGSIEIDHLT